MDPVAVSRGRRLTRAVVYAVVVAVPLGMLAFLVRTKYDPLVTLDQDIIVAATDYTRGHPRFRSFVETWEVISQPVVMYLLLGLPVSLYVWFGRHLRTRAWWALATMATGWAIAVVLKLLVRRARPEIDDPIAQHAGLLVPLRSRHQQRHRRHRGRPADLAPGGYRPQAAAGRPRCGLGDRDVRRPDLSWARTSCPTSRPACCSGAA